MSEFDLTAAEQAQVEADNGNIIKADQTTVEIYRATEEGAGEFDGPHATGWSLVATVDGEFVEDAGSEILEPDCDAVCDTPYGTNADKDDRVINLKTGKSYAVHHAKHFNLSAAKTFLRLHLERKY